MWGGRPAPTCSSEETRSIIIITQLIRQHGDMIEVYKILHGIYDKDIYI